MNLREVVEQTVRDQLGQNPDTAIVGEYVLIAATHGFDQDGDQTSQIVILPDGSPHSRILGLVHMARAMLEREALESD